MAKVCKNKGIKFWRSPKSEWTLITIPKVDNVLHPAIDLAERVRIAWGGWLGGDQDNSGPFKEISIAEGLQHIGMSLEAVLQAFHKYRNRGGTLIDGKVS